MESDLPAISFVHAEPAPLAGFDVAMPRILMPWYLIPKDYRICLSETNNCANIDCLEII